MSKQLFEVGDKVFCPIVGGKIQTLYENEYSSAYPLTIVEYSDDEINTFNEHGQLYCGGIQVLYLATPENYAMLSERHPDIVFQKPE